MSGHWENGDNVNTTLFKVCSSFGTGSMCKDKSSNNLEFKSKPNPAPNPDFFAVLNKPGINRHVMRGCFKTNNNLTDPDADFNETSPWENEYRLNTEICDDYQGSWCSGSSRRKEKCRNDAPGGLADFTHPMSLGSKQGKYEDGSIKFTGDDYIQYGFVMDKCECSLDIPEMEKSDYPGVLYNVDENGNNKYTCWENKKYRAREINIIWDVSPGKCCSATDNKKCITEGYNINHGDGPECSDFQYRGNEYNNYQPGELWDGRTSKKSFSNLDPVDYPSKCYTWYNPSIDELPDDKKDKNNCSQYLKKWALSCKFCKENRPTNDGLSPCDITTNNCDVIKECAGECVVDSNTGTKLCSTELKDDACKICDSKLWEQIPGGWEALADENHNQHLMAKFAYIPKVVKARGANKSNETVCLQPNATMFNGKPILAFPGKNVESSNKRVTTFMGLGPYLNDYIIDSKDTVDNYKSNTPNSLSGGSGVGCSEYSWTQNSNILNDQSMIVNSIECLKLEKGDCEKDMTCYYDEEHDKCLTNYQDNGYVNTGNQGNNNLTKWSDPIVVGDKNIDIENLSSCNFKEGKGGHIYNPRSHNMCMRNPNLTGYGESDKENGYYANLWLDGLWDMSAYTGKQDDLQEEGISEEVKKTRKVEALRCCLGLSPIYETEDGLNYDIINVDGIREVEKERHKYCRPGFVCPSSDACKELYRDLFEDEVNFYEFGSSYPKGYKLEGSSELSKDVMTNTNYYAKTYCEMMGGGMYEDNIDENIGCGKDPDAEINCRKAMYNYCVEPVQVNVPVTGIEDGVGMGIKTSKISYPLRVFSDSCKDWCKQDSGELSESLPSQKGVCDMAIGRTCQQLQVDGWIDPENWDNSKLLKFANQGNWIEQSPEGAVQNHENLTSKRIKNVCGCFLLGAQCGDRNCSVSYCGAGTDGNKGPGMVKFGKNKDYKRSFKEGCGNEFEEVKDGNVVNTAICDMKAVYDFDGDVESRGWTDHINSDKFFCDNSLSQYDQCFNGCNYVNYNDTCWLASPDERKQDLVTENFKDINVWPCKDVNVGESCKTYDNNYGCFGNCAIDDYTKTDPKGNCGTEEWFNHRMNINPNEVRYKQRKSLIEKLGLDKKANITYDWPQWQNFYTYWDQVPQDSPLQDPDTTYTIPGWGSYKTGSDGKPEPYNKANISDPNRNMCSFPGCADPDSVKPYRYYPTKDSGTIGLQCKSNCSVNIQTNLNNQGMVIGGIVNSLNGKYACTGIDDIDPNWNPESISNSGNASYISLMGKNDCGTVALDEDCSRCKIDDKDQFCKNCVDLLKCGYGSEMCIDPIKVGVDKNNGEDVLSGDNCNLCLNPKPDICCTSPNINPYTDQQSEQKISWTMENNKILGIVGNRNSYICGNTCPNGSVNLNSLESEACGELLCHQRDESSCGNCERCIWVPENTEALIEGHCSAQCPLAPNNDINGWGKTLNINVPNPEFIEPEITNPPKVTNPPIVTNPPNGNGNEGNGTEGNNTLRNIGVGVLITVVAISLIGTGIYIYKKNKNKIEIIK